MLVLLGPHGARVSAAVARLKSTAHELSLRCAEFARCYSQLSNRPLNCEWSMGRYISALRWQVRSDLITEHNLGGGVVASVDFKRKFGCDWSLA